MINPRNKADSDLGIFLGCFRRFQGFNFNYRFAVLFTSTSSVNGGLMLDLKIKRDAIDYSDDISFLLRLSSFAPFDRLREQIKSQYSQFA